MKIRKKYIIKAPSNHLYVTCTACSCSLLITVSIRFISATNSKNAYDHLMQYYLSIKRCRLVIDICNNVHTLLNLEYMHILMQCYNFENNKITRNSIQRTFNAKCSVIKFANFGISQTKTFCLNGLQLLYHNFYIHLYIFLE